MSTFLYLCQLKKTHSLEEKEVVIESSAARGKPPWNPQKTPLLSGCRGGDGQSKRSKGFISARSPSRHPEKEEEEDPSPYIPAIRRGEPELRQISGLRCPRINFLHSSMVHASLSRAVLPVRSAALSLAQEIIKIDPFATTTLRTHKRDPELDFMIAAESLDQP